MKAEKSPVPFLFGFLMDKLSSREKIEKAEKAANLTGIPDDDLDTFLKEVKKSKKNIEDIKKHMELLITVSQQGGTEEEKSVRKQFFNDMITL